MCSLLGLLSKMHFLNFIYNIMCLNQSSHSKVMSPSTTLLQLVFTNLQKYHLVENLIINTFSKTQLSAYCFCLVVYSVAQARICTGRNMYMHCIYLFTKEGSSVLFCFVYEIHQTRMLQIMFSVSSESFQ
jgi:hypothetical protein